MVIRVGIVGANPERGWALRAHVPALRSLPDYRITAVGTSRAETASVAAQRFGAEHAFTDPRRLAEHPDVDLVAVTVRTATHRELAGTALAAGKHVYCEWPLARTTAEAAELVTLAGTVHTAIGLQSRYAPAVVAARAAIDTGYVGRVLSVAVHATRAKGAGGTVPDWAAYTLDVGSGAGTLEVAGGHTLDVVRHVVGDVVPAAATLTTRQTTHTVAGTGRTVTATGPDLLSLTGTAGGAPLTALIHDGRVTNAGTRIEIAGTDGDLALVSTGPEAPAGVQIGALRLLGSQGGPWRELAGDPEPGEGRNVARQYAALADDLRTGARTVPDFRTGLAVHHLLDAVRAAASVSAE
ncbi:Gfo/Idh/MocA family protein [Actinocatenispora rupis]|uniref:Oxidoreductase n=1 Tax=Actinocatenispora rupis TaxID=519421 RepID=A0A8J3JEU3_9ACTN|nr:Gfo/Idh/MocA family oxidoreductase [Actinocatenispora rupis]GID14638.1 oxidoreductase [Actinocatenispora rupis]